MKQFPIPQTSISFNNKYVIIIINTQNIDYTKIPTEKQRKCHDYLMIMIVKHASQV
jgi:hypothetical protein